MPFNDPLYITSIIIGAAILIIGLLLAFRKHQSRLTAWSEFAGRLGLIFESPKHFWSGARVTGVYRSRPVVLHTFTRHVGKNTEVLTGIAMKLKEPSPMQFLIYEEGVGGKISKMFGAQDIRIGVESIDNRFMIKGKPEEEIVKFLSSIDIQQRLLSVPKLHIEIDGNDLRFERQGVISDTLYLENVFTLLGYMADKAETRGV